LRTTSTRIVEQTVHIDDLARSLRRDPFPWPEQAQELTIHVGVDIGQRVAGATSMIRALYRQGFADKTLPVI
jgi:hypothetical protein